MDMRESSKLNEITEKMNNIIDVAENEERGLTDDEVTLLSTLSTEAQKIMEKLLNNPLVV